MRLPPPAGKSTLTVRNLDFRSADFEKLVKGRAYVCVSFDNGWVVVGKNEIFAAFYEDAYEFLAGFDAFAKLAEKCRTGQVCEIDKAHLNFLTRIYPELLVRRPFSEVMLDVRSLDVIDNLVGSHYFTVEEEKVKSTSAPDVLESEAGIQKDDSAVAPSAGLWVMNLEEYLNSLEDFTGIIEASDGALVFTFWVKGGEVKAAKLVDGDFVITGNSVLYFSSIPARVVQRPWVDPPSDALCIESEAGVKALYASLDRGESV
jgi:hypothetical protein